MQQNILKVNFFHLLMSISSSTSVALSIKLFLQVAAWLKSYAAKYVI